MHLIDTHAHLDFPDFKEDLDSVIENAARQGVQTILTIGTTIEGSRRAIELAEKHPGVFAVVGVHPTSAEEAPDDIITPLRELAAHPKVAAIGETGLDYHRLPSGRKIHDSREATRALGSSSMEDNAAAIRDGAYKSTQAAIFQEQLDLAVELGLNVVIHERDAWRDTLEILEPYHGKLKAVFHCFGGGPKDAEELTRHGHLVSFTGIVTFKNAEPLQETAAKISEASFMLETDAPFLAPEPDRGRRCEPAHVRRIAEEVAHLRGATVEAIAEATTRNARDFFRLSA